MAMSFTTLTGSKTTEGSIKYLVNNSAIPSATILENAQGLIYSLLRVREMLGRVEDTFALSSVSDTLPDRFQEAKSITLLGDYGAYKKELKIFPPDDYERKLTYDSAVQTPTRPTQTPSFCTIDATNILLDAKCDVAYFYVMWCYRYGAPLSTTVETNFLTNRYPHLLTAAVRHYAFDCRQHDELAEKELKKLASYIQQINIEHDYQKAAYTYEHHWER
jgi:hypothetical protein